MTNLPLGIKSWDKADRPREKLIDKGVNSLSNSELIAILIGSGNRNESAVALANKILLHYKYDLNQMSMAGIAELTKFKGIGEAKAISIVAAMELAKRKKLAGVERQKKITTSNDAFVVCEPHLEGLTHEEFWVMFLNRNNRIIKLENMSKGGVAGTVVDPRIIFKKAIEKLSSSLILIHNHPSGNLKPSSQDVQITNKMVESGKFLEIKVLDHLIISSGGYFSFADEGLI